MACTPTPTATLYATVSTFVPSTSFSQNAVNTAQLTTLVQQSCVVSGMIGGTSVGCISSTQVTQVNTVGDSGQVAQVPIVVSVPVVESQPTQTLFASCTKGGGSSFASQSPAQSSIIVSLTTSVLVQSTPPPTTVVEASSATLADGSVVQTVVTLVTTLPPTAVYVPTSLASPSLQSSTPQGSGRNVAPIVGGVLGGFLGLIAIVGSLWWLCRRRRRSWDDIFEKEALEDDDAWAPVALGRGGRDGRMLDLGAEPRPYQYGLVGHVVPPRAASELRTSRHGSVSEHSGTHSRHTSYSATPLLQGAHTVSSRPSTAGSVLTVQTHPGPGARPLSTTLRSSRPVSDGIVLAPCSTNMDDLAVPGPSNGSGSPVSSTERRILQVVNDVPTSPIETAALGARRASSRPSSNVIVHTDGGRVQAGSSIDPPPYSR